MSRRSTPRIAADVHMFPLDTEALLFRESAQEFYVLNATAAVIWCFLEEGRDETGMAAQLASTLGTDLAQATVFVTSALDDWSAKGFLAQPAADAPQPAARAASAARLTPVPNSDLQGIVAERWYGLLNARVQVRFTDPAQQALVHPALAHLECASGAATDVIDVVAGDRGATVYRAGEARGTDLDATELAPLVKGELWEAALQSYDFLLGIHAGVVATPNGCILLPGPAGSGKSTLTAALVHAGLDYFSDELAILSGSGLDVTPFPLSFCVKSTGIDPLAGFFPALRELPLHLRADGRQVAYMPPPSDRIARQPDHRPVHIIVHPRFDATVTTQWRPITMAESARLLLAECLIVPKPLSIDAVQRFVAWLGRTKHAKLTFSDLPTATNSVLSHLT